MKQPMSLRKRTVLQDVLLVLFAAVTLFSALLTVLSLIPEPAGLSVRERVTVSSARVNMEEECFQVESRGRLRNTSDRSVQVERVTVTVGGKNGITLEVTEPFTLPARADYDLILSGTAAHAVEGTPEITAVVDGKTVSLRNPADTPLAATLVPLAFLILFGILTLRAVRVRRYLAQEAKLPAAEH